MASTWGELLRFGLSGATNTVLAYGVYAGLIYAGAHYALALIGDYLFAIAFSLIVNKFFTFRHEGSFSVSMVASMAATYGALFLVNLGAAVLLVDVLKWNVLLSQALATVLIGGLSFLLQRTVVFPQSRRP